MSYQPIDVVASRIEATEAEMTQLVRRGWISTTEKNGIVFVAGKFEYKARFILRLRQQWSLTDEEIGRVLDVQEPPYSLKDVPRILGRKLP